MMGIGWARAVLLLPPLLVGTAAVATGQLLEPAATKVGWDALVLIGVMASVTTAISAPSHRLAGASEKAGKTPQEVSQWTTDRRTSNRRETDRRLPIVDRTSGLFAHWYFLLRVEEEIRRAERYGGVFTVVTIETPTSDWERVVARIVIPMLRRTDLAGGLGQVVALLLVHTPETGAGVIVDRIRAKLPAGRFCSRTYPVDGTTTTELLGKDNLWQPVEGFSSAL